MRLLLLGSGGREHALAWKLSQSPLVSSFTAAPGNPGIGEHARCLPVDPTRPDSVLALAREISAELVVVGPEAPLVAGVADALRAQGVAVFGPDQAAARIEGSKAFAKEVMQAAGVPTGRYEVFDDAAAAAGRARRWGALVVKADGLAAGKGVVVADSGEEAGAACEQLGNTPAGQRLLLEERLFGPELSVMALCDGERYLLLPPARDHKRLLEGDRGPNTGGMGAFAPAPLLSVGSLEAVGHRVIAPTLRELARRGSPFRGALYAGLMLTAEGPKVLEFNCRLGDPETQPIMMQLEGDLLPTLLACALGGLPTRPEPLAVKPGVSVGVVLAARGYPEAPATGDEIEGLDRAPRPGTARFHSGTRRDGEKIVTGGGRVMTICAHGPSLAAARELAYAELSGIRFAGRHCRGDIGLAS